MIALHKEMNSPTKIVGSSKLVIQIMQSVSGNGAAPIAKPKAISLPFGYFADHRINDWDRAMIPRCSGIP